MPKRKAGSNKGGGGGSSRQRTGDDDGKSSHQQEEGSLVSQQHAVVETFCGGLSHQIPVASLSHIANNMDSIRLLLEKSTESLPMGSGIRKAVGENFPLCVKELQSQIEKRIEEHRALSKSAEDLASAEQEGPESDFHESEFAVFSSAQYEKAFQKRKSISNKEEAEQYRKQLACTDYATSDVTIPRRNEKPSAKDVLGAFQSASMAGQVTDATIGGYVSTMLASLKDEVDRDPGFTASLIRDFSGCYTMSCCAKVSTALDYGKLLGLLLFLALTEPAEYNNSGRDYTIASFSDDDSATNSDSSSDSDIEDNFGPASKKDGAQAQTQMRNNASRDIVSTLTLVLMGNKSAAPYIINGIIDSVKEKLSNSKSNKSDKSRMERASNLLMDTFVASNVVPTGALPGKLIKSGYDKINIVQKWAQNEMEKSSKRQISMVGEGTSGSLRAATYRSHTGSHGGHIDSDGGSGESSSEEQEDDEDMNDRGGDDTFGATTDEATNGNSLFVIDTAPAIDDDKSDADGEIEEMQTVTKGQDIKDVETDSGKPPRPSSSSKRKSATQEEEGETGAPKLRRSARSRSRGDSINSKTSS